MTIDGSGDLVAFLWLARHEAWHLFGVRHVHFPAAVMHLEAGSRASIAELFGIAEGTTLSRKAAPAPKTKPSTEERAAAKLDRLAEREKAWATKLKRAETALAKIRKSKRYYEKQIAVAAASKGRTP